MVQNVAKWGSEITATMLLSLWARAQETNRPDALLHDPSACQMVARLDYDFSVFRNAAFPQAGACVRARVIDDELRASLVTNPRATVIQLGAGLDTRYARLHAYPFSYWYDLDLPEVIALRQELLPEGERNTYLAQSLFDYSWVETVQNEKQHVIIILEGVLMYFEPERVRDFFSEISQRFERVTVIFDMLIYGVLGKTLYKNTQLTTDAQLAFRWSELDSHIMETWNSKIHLVAEYYLSDYDHGRFPLLFRLLYRIPYFYRRFNQRVLRLEIY